MLISCRLLFTYGKSKLICSTDPKEWGILFSGSSCALHQTQAISKQKAKIEYKNGVAKQFFSSGEKIQRGGKPSKPKIQDNSPLTEQEETTGHVEAQPDKIEHTRKEHPSKWTCVRILECGFWVWPSIYWSSAHKGCGFGRRLTG